LPDLFREFIADLRPTGSHGGREVVHLQAFGIEADFGQNGFQVADPLGSIEISFQEMTLALQSPGHEKAVHPPLERAQHVAVVQFAGAGHADDLDVVGIAQPHDTG